MKRSTWSVSGRSAALRDLPRGLAGSSVVVTGFPPFILPPPEAVAAPFGRPPGSTAPSSRISLRRSSRSSLGLARRRRARPRRRLRAGAQPARRARPLALPRRRPGDADPRARPAHRAVVRAGAARQGPDLRADRLLPGRGLDDGRRSARSMPGCSSSAAALRATRRQVLTHARDPGRAAIDLRRAPRRGHARGRRRDRRRMGRRRPRPRRPHQPRPRLALRHPAACSRRS